MIDILNGRPLRLLVVSALTALIVIACNESGSDARALEPEQLSGEVLGAFAEATQMGRITRLTSLLEQLNPDNLSAVLDVYDKRMAGLSNAEVGCFMSAWAQFDPIAAVDYAKSIPFETQREEALGVAIQEWALQNPLNARTTAEALELPGRKRAAQPLVRLVRGWVHHSLRDLEVYLHENPTNSDLLSAAVQEIYRIGNAESLMRWADAFIATTENADHRWQTFRKTVRTLGFREPNAVTGWVSEHYGVDEYARDGPEILALAWLRRDPPAAIDWVVTDSPPEARDEAIQAAFSRWVSADPSAADAWLAARPEGPELYSAYVATARLAVRGRDPERAIEYCGRVPSSDLKQKCLHALATIWYGYAPVAAGEWMESSELDPELRDAVRASQQRLRKRRPDQP